MFACRGLFGDGAIIGKSDVKDYSLPSAEPFWKRNELLI
jgi:hypothetical protein